MVAVLNNRVVSAGISLNTRLCMSLHQSPNNHLCGVSVQKIEAPVRGGIPDGGPPVSERNWGQEKLNPDLKSDKWNPEKKVLGTEVGIVDSFRYRTYQLR